jgi:hypothetical protein
MCQNAPSDGWVTEFGALTPLMENGGTNGGLAQHLPWYWDAATGSIYQYFATLHSELGSYNFSYGVEAHLTGTSIIRGSDKKHTPSICLAISFLRRSSRLTLPPNP